MTLSSDELQARARRQKRIDPWLSFIVVRLIEEKGLGRQEVADRAYQTYDWLRQRLHGRVHWSLQDVDDIAVAFGLTAPALVEMAYKAQQYKGKKPKE